MRGVVFGLEAPEGWEVGALEQDDVGVIGEDDGEVDGSGA